MNQQLRKIFGSALTLGVLAAGVMFTGSAKADVLKFDSTLANGTYYGTGNPTGGWTVDTNNGVQVGLRAQYRYADAIYTPTDDYSVQPGACITAPCNTGGNKPALALWNYNYSIDLTGTALTLSDVMNYTFLTVTAMNGLVPVETVTFRPLVDITDNALLNTNKGAQNSENLGWIPVGGTWPTAFNPNAGYEYDFSLVVGSSSNASLAAVDIEIQPTPEPSAVILFGTALLGAFTLIRRKRNA